MQDTITDTASCAHLPIRELLSPMTREIADILDDVRSKFAHVDSDPFTGPRIFFENAGGALTLKSVVETSGFFASMPDNAGRANVVGQKLVEIINKGKEDALTFFGTGEGQVFAGESGTELLFRLIRTACLNAPAGPVVGSSIEHPATRSAARRWAEETNRSYIEVTHDDATGTVSADAYARHLTADTAVVTILHTSPVTGMTNDVVAITQAVRATCPDAFIIIDGIQHASHGHIDLSAASCDGYVVSPYKVFSRHGYGLAWASERLSGANLEALLNGPTHNWELGTRDAGAYATFTDVVEYFEWLGGAVSDADSPRAKIEAAAKAIHVQEKTLTDALLYGTGNLPGLTEMDGVTIIGGAENAAREGLVCFAHAQLPAEDIVAKLNAAGVRTHVRKADHYSGNVLTPLGLDAAVRVSLCHYNSLEEVAAFLGAMRAISE